MAGPGASGLPDRSDAGGISRPDQKRTERNRRDLCHLRKTLAMIDNEGMSYVREFFGICCLQALDQIIRPSYEARIYAVAEQAWDEKTDNVKVGPVVIEIGFEHMAKALRLDLVEFERCALDLKTGFESYINTGVVREHLDPDISRQLAAVFGIQPPPLILDVDVARQLYAQFARHHRDEVTVEVANMLKAIGVKPPRKVAKRSVLPASCKPQKSPPST